MAVPTKKEKQPALSTNVGDNKRYEGGRINNCDHGTLNLDSGKNIQIWIFFCFVIHWLQWLDADPAASTSLHALVTYTLALCRSWFVRCSPNEVSIMKRACCISFATANSDSLECFVPFTLRTKQIYLQLVAFCLTILQKKKFKELRTLMLQQVPALHWSFEMYWSTQVL